MAKTNLPIAPEVPVAGDLPTDQPDPRDARIAALEAELEASTKRVVDAVEANEHLRDALTRADFRDAGDAAQSVRALVELDRALSHAGRPNPRLLRAAELIGGDLAARILSHFEGRPALDDRGPSDAG